MAATAVLKEIEMTRQEMAQRQVTLKSILGRDRDSRNIEISDRAPTVMPEHLDRDRLMELAVHNPSQVRMAETEAGKSEVGLRLAQEDYIPDFTAGYSYQKTGPGFRDYYMLSLGAKIPLYFWRKQKPAVEQAAQNWAALTETHDPSASPPPRSCVRASATRPAKSIATGSHSRRRTA